MRHRVYGRKLTRNKNQRTALFKNLVQSLILHGSIKTTEAKVKAVKGLVDKIINQAKSQNSKVQTFLTNKEVREKLLKEIIPTLKNRNSGYTSFVRLGPRKGDGAMMMRMSLLVNEEEKLTPSLKTRDGRSSRNKKPKTKK
ncbi:50S ribosomal protein L17 [Candidatus Daviesbacteria bacterium]|nr:50S ribosomal protein L17 [Candidatus Daviesbacteria bacterium]